VTARHDAIKQRVDDEMADSITRAQYQLVRHGSVHTQDGEVPTEESLTIFVNGRELVTLMCSPVDTEALALGFLLNEGIIARREDVRLTTACKRGGCVDVWLDFDLDQMPERRTITTGCGGGLTFADLTAERPPLQSQATASPAQLQNLMNALYNAAALHNRVGGFHSAALARAGADTPLLVTEDVGRHNTLDRLHGMAFMQGIDTRECVLLTTGRISSEMLVKARHMETPFVVSRTSPTNLSIRLAEAWQVTLIGYLRHDRLTVYAHPWRLQTSP
jgi:FdhD protein